MITYRKAGWVFPAALLTPGLTHAGRGWRSSHPPSSADPGATSLRDRAEGTAAKRPVPAATRVASQVCSKPPPPPHPPPRTQRTPAFRDCMTPKLLARVLPAQRCGFPSAAADRAGSRTRCEAPAVPSVPRVRKRPRGDGVLPAWGGGRMSSEDVGLIKKKKKRRPRGHPRRRRPRARRPPPPRTQRAATPGRQPRAARQLRTATEEPAERAGDPRGPAGWRERSGD